MNSLKRYIDSYNEKKIKSQLPKDDLPKLYRLENYGVISKLTFIAILFTLLEVFYLVSDIINGYYDTHGFLHLYAILTILIPSIGVLCYTLSVRNKYTYLNQVIAFIYYCCVVGGMLIFLISDIQNDGQTNVTFYNIFVLSICPIFDKRLFIPLYILPILGSSLVITFATAPGQLTYFSYEQPIVLCAGCAFATAFFRKTALRSYVQQIKLESLSLEYEAISKKDFLTGLANRTALDEFKKTTVADAIKRDFSISVTMVDIDDFKKYNDYYGHLAGDECLKEVANQIRGLDNEKIHTFRYGGEEFLTVIINSQEEDVKLHNELVLLNVRNIKIDRKKIPSAKEYVTISMGSSSKKVKSLEEFDELLVEADKNLYLSKETGKNQITY